MQVDFKGLWIDHELEDVTKLSCPQCGKNLAVRGEKFICVDDVNCQHEYDCGDLLEVYNEEMKDITGSSVEDIFQKPIKLRG